MSSHTNGPWTVGKWKDGHEVLVDAPNGDQDFKYGKWEGLATVYGNEDHVDFNESHEKCLANARLIAAAPELLEALQFFVAEHDSVADTMGEPMMGPGPWKCGCDLCKTALSIIAKATGKS